jgi:hypothetical protein
MWLEAVVLQEFVHRELLLNSAQIRRDEKADRRTGKTLLKSLRSLPGQTANQEKRQ